MIKYNVIVVYDKTESSLLMCKREKDPYKGLLNFVGGKIEPGECSMDAAYRELFEETGISKTDIILTHVMDFNYLLSGFEMEVYSGKLSKDIALKEELNHLIWISRSENFCDNDRFAGNCNIEHILEQVDMHKEQSLK